MSDSVRFEASMEAYTLCESCSGFLNNLVVNTGEPPLVEKAKSLFKSCAKCSIVVNEKTLPSAKKARELIKDTNANEKHVIHTTDGFMNKCPDLSSVQNGNRNKKRGMALCSLLKRMALATQKKVALSEHFFLKSFSFCFLLV